MHSELGNILYDLAKFPDTQITVNTTGIPLIDHQGILTNTPNHVKFIISLDSANSEVFNKIRPTKIPNAHEKAIESAYILSKKGVLKRLNMVITKENQDGVNDMIQLCKLI